MESRRPRRLWGQAGLRPRRGIGLRSEATARQAAALQEDGFPGETPSLPSAAGQASAVLLWGYWGWLRRKVAVAVVPVRRSVAWICHLPGGSLRARGIWWLSFPFLASRFVA